MQNVFAKPQHRALSAILLATCLASPAAPLAEKASRTLAEGGAALGLVNTAAIGAVYDLQTGENRTRPHSSGTLAAEIQRPLDPVSLESTWPLPIDHGARATHCADHAAMTIRASPLRMA
jgi:hypothetical protein